MRRPTPTSRRRGEERDPPAPPEERLLPGDHLDDGEDAGRGNRPAGTPSAASCRRSRACPGARVRRPAAPRRPTRRRRRCPGRSAAAGAGSGRGCRSRVRRQQADQEGADAHEQQRGDERRLATDAVAECRTRRRPAAGRGSRRRRCRRLSCRDGLEPGRTGRGTPARRRGRRGRSRTTRSWCRRLAATTLRRLRLFSTSDASRRAAVDAMWFLPSQGGAGWPLP